MKNKQVVEKAVVVDELATMVDGVEVYWCPKCERELPRTMFRQNKKGCKSSKTCLDCLNLHKGTRSVSAVPKGFDASYFCSGCHIYEYKRSSWDIHQCFGHQCLRWDLYKAKKLPINAAHDKDAPIPEVIEKSEGSLTAVLNELDVKQADRDQSAIVRKARYNKVGKMIGYENTVKQEN